MPAIAQPKPLAITTGEPAGIGPEITIQMALQGIPQQIVILADRQLLLDRAQLLQLNVATVAAWPDYTPGTSAPISVLHVALAAPSIAGELNPANAHYVLTLLDRATAGCVAGEFAAMVTAPLHKGVINDGTTGAYFSGHTEYLAAQTNTHQVVMMLAGEYRHGDAPEQQMRVALATTHLPLKDVSSALTIASLRTTLQILDRDLRSKFGLKQPRILVAGLNPHAGESGHMGREEIDVIIPVLDELRAQGMTLIGPLPADTLFNPPILAQGDAVLAMFHDQGLPVLKFATFGAGINITLGLPIIRTSVDHGTALNIAGLGVAEIGSLIAATQLAAQLSTNQ